MDLINFSDFHYLKYLKKSYFRCAILIHVRGIKEFAVMIHFIRYIKKSRYYFISHQ